MRGQSEMFPGLIHPAPVADPRVDPEDVPRLRGHNLTIYARLKEGPATNVQLATLLGPASAWRTRVSNVRRWLEDTSQGTISAEKIDGGVWLYSLEGECST